MLGLQGPYWGAHLWDKSMPAYLLVRVFDFVWGLRLLLGFALDLVLAFAPPRILWAGRARDFSGVLDNPAATSNSTSASSM